MATENRIVQGGGSLSGAIVLPLNYQDVAGLDQAWAQRALAETRRFWQEFPLLRLAFSVPDPAVNEMIEALARNILQAREIKEGLPVFQVGPTCYRGLWVVDGHFFLEAAQYLGYADDAMGGIGTLLKRVKPDGSITQMPFHTKETGISIANGERPPLSAVRRNSSATIAAVTGPSA